MASLENIDMTNVPEPTNNFEPIPNGEYKAIIENSEMKDTKAGTGKYLALTFKIIDGDSNSRLIWENLNVVNPNQTAVEIGKQSLKAIQGATGVLNPTDSAQLHNIPILIVIKVKDDSYTGGKKSVIVGYKKIVTGSVNQNQTSTNTVTDEDVPF